MGLDSEASNLLKEQFKDLVWNPVNGISVALVDGRNMLLWNLTIVGPPRTIYEEGIFNAIMSFPRNYPHSPPTVEFTSEIFHPNYVGSDGKVFIPILNPPGIETASECWSPVYTVRTILWSIMSMLSSPIDDVDQNENFPTYDESPAEVEACAMHDTSIPRKNSACYCKEDHHFELKSINKLFKCDGCKQQGAGRRHVCIYCDYELHEKCKSPKHTITHEFFGDSEFQFSENPQVGRCCDVCGKDILGFNYQSVDKRYDLHPCCSKLLKKQPIDGTLFELHKKVSTRCIWCLKKKISEDGVPGWAYVSRCKNYTFHVHCLTEMLQINASSKDGNLGLEKIELCHLDKSKTNDRRSKTFVSAVKIFLATVLSVLLGDPTTLLASTIVQSIFNG